MTKKLQIKSWLLMLCMMLGAGSVWADTYVQLTSVADIDETAEYVLGIDGTGFHYTGTSSWGKVALPTAETPLYYTLTKAADGTSFTAKTTIGGTVYYLQIPTTNTFDMATTTATNSDIVIGTTKVAETNYAVANKATTDRHLRVNGTSGLRSYAGTTGTMAFFYKRVATTTPTVSFITASKFIAVGETYTQTAVVQNASGVTVSYSSSNTAVATVNASTGLVKAVSAGTTTITGTITVGGTTYTGTYTVEVVAVEDGVFDFSGEYDYGSGAMKNGTNMEDGSVFTAGNITLTTSGSCAWYATGGAFRVYSGASFTVAAPAGYVINTIDFEGTQNLADVTISSGTLTGSGTAATWTGAAQTVTITRGTVNPFYSKITVTYGTAPDVAAPVSSVLTETYSTAQTVTLTCDTESADIYYTTDGSEPSATSGTKYTTPINVAATTTLKAVAVKGDVASTVLSVTITIPTITYASIAALKTAAPTEPVILQLTDAQVYYKNSSTDLYVGDASGALDFYKAGLNYSAGTVLNGSLVVTGYTVYKSLPEITGVADNQLTATEGTLAPAVVTADDVTLADYECQLVQVRGTYTVDGSNTYVDDLLIYNKFNKTLPEELADGVDIVVTGIVVPFNDAPELAITALTIPDGTVPSAPTLSLVGQTIDPAEVYFVNAQSVAANVAAGTVVYYTTDGSEPTTASTVYAEPITITQTTTVKAIAVKDGETSEVATLTVNIYGGGSGLNGDVDGNGSITIADVTKLVNIILGKE